MFISNNSPSFHLWWKENLVNIEKYQTIMKLIVGPILDHIFAPKKYKIFRPVFVSCRDMPNVIWDLVLYLQSEGWNISWIYTGTIPFQYLKTSSQYSIILRH